MSHINCDIRSFSVNALSAAVAVALFSHPADTLAQQAGAQRQLEEVVVTGSRIRRFEGDFVSPVVTVDAEQMENSGKVNLEDFVSELAALVGSDGTFETGGGGSSGPGDTTGLNILNLRNLGTERTLVLVNGRRHVSALGSGQPLVDTNSIPTALVERVDVLTGGASAVYGADAVTGAVNFVLRDDFEGLTVRSQGALSDRGDAGEVFTSLVWGNNFNNGRGNITTSYEFRKQKLLQTFERDFGLSEAEFLVNNPAEFRKADDPNVPDQIIAKDRRFNLTAPSGRFDILGTDPATGQELRLGDLSLNNLGGPFDNGTQVSGSTSLGGDGTPTRFFSNELLPATKTHSFNLLGRYDISDAATFYSELKYNRNDAYNPRSSSFTSNLEMSLENPFIPDQFFDVLANIEDPSINLARDDTEVRAQEDNRRETFRGVWGVRGDLTDWLNYDFSFNRGVTQVKAGLVDQRLEDRYFAALDAVTDPQTGEPTCRSNLDPTAVPPTDVIVSSYNPDAFGDPANSTFVPGPGSGCIPFNPFVDGRSGFFLSGSVDPDNPNAEAIKWITGNDVPLVDSGKVKQTVINGFVGGDTSGMGFSLPGGPAEYVLGAEYRKERARNDITDIRNNVNALTFLGFERDFNASFDVYEVFTEVSLPVFSDLGPFLQGLRIDGAYRFSDYSTISTTNTFSVGGVWTLNDQVILRGSRSRAVRAPNLNELFEPENEASFRPEDPCELSNLDAQSPNTIANCRADLATLGLTPEEFLSASPVGRPGIQSGNEELQEEESNTWTVGIVLTPTALPGFVAAFDAWSVELTDGVLRPSDDEIVAQCFEAPSLDNQFCDLFERAPADSEVPGVIINLQQQPVNVSSISTKGVDFSLSYSTDLGQVLGQEAGSLSLTFAGTRLRELVTQPTVAPILQDEAGETETLLGGRAPATVFNFDSVWRRGPLSIAYGIHFESEQNLFDDVERALDPDISEFRHTDRLWVHEVQVDYSFNNLSLGAYRAYAGVRNIGDRLPDRTFLNLPIGPVGRVFYAGVTLNFGAQ